MRIYLGADHAGFELKEVIKTWLEKNGHEVKDFGAHKYNEKDDYPDFIFPVAKAVARSRNKSGMTVLFGKIRLAEVRGIVLGGSGQGEAMICNRFKGVRAAVYYGAKKDIVTLSREHNDANVLSLGARFLTKKEALWAVEKWLDTKFAGEVRHQRRIAKIG